MYYFYQGTVITVRPGLGGDNWATCKRKPNGGWTAVKSPAMPRVNDYAAAINNLRAWAAEKGLRKADCGCCWHQKGGYCRKRERKLETIQGYEGNIVNLRCPSCDEMEAKTK